MLREAQIKRVKVLSIDGGGVRGIIAGSIVLAIETELQRRLCDNNARLAQHLDVLAGTSTGSILSALYLLPADPSPSVEVLLKNPSAQFRFSAVDALDLYLNQAPKIFGTSFMSKMWTMGGWDGPLYSPKPLEDMLQGYVGSTMLSQLVRSYIAVAYDIDAGEPYTFSCTNGRASTEDYFLRDVIRASSAAPTYFPPASIIPAGKSESRHFIDGGLVANNPSVCALSQVREEHGDDAEVVMISISCGRLRDICPYDKAKNWGKMGWVSPVIAVTMDSNSRLADLEAGEQLHTRGKYFRFDTPLLSASINMDDCSPKNIAALQADAASYLRLPEVIRMVREVVDQILRV